MKEEIKKLREQLAALNYSRDPLVSPVHKHAVQDNHVVLGPLRFNVSIDEARLVLDKINRVARRNAMTPKEAFLKLCS